MKKKRVALFLFLLFAGFSGCSSKHIIVLVPDPDGSTGRIVVSNQAGSVEIDTPYQATNIQDNNTIPAHPTPMDKDKINAIFAEALAIQPTAPIHFLLYFENDMATLHSGSLSVLPKIVETIIARNSVDISIIGHTDTTGDKNYNLKLSTRRAESVSRLLIERGIKPEYLEISSHGKENPLIRTEDNVSEPRNRRVEVVVR
ncbi:MAG: OmpA family protein [Deltaproteobacteria bacterium]|nr:OmpA family protein [Deltaproteobacteria bacterium]